MVLSEAYSGQLCEYLTTKSGSPTKEVDDGS